MLFPGVSTGFLLHVKSSKAVSGLRMNPGGGKGGTPYDGLYGEVPLEKGFISSLEVYETAGISRAEVKKRAGKTAI